MSFMGHRGFTDRPVVAASLAAGATGADLALSSTLAVTGASTLTGDIAAGNINMASGKVLVAAAGTSAANSIQFAGSSAGMGFNAATADKLVIARGGTGVFSVDTTTTVANALVSTSQVQVNSAWRMDAEAVKTGDYTVATTDTIVLMNGVSLTATLPPTPGTDQLVFIKNLAATSVTIARNGNNIDGAAADLTLLTTTAVLLYFEPATGWQTIAAK